MKFLILLFPMLFIVGASLGLVFAAVLQGVMRAWKYPLVQFSNTYFASVVSVVVMLITFFVVMFCVIYATGYEILAFDGVLEALLGAMADILRQSPATMGIAVLICMLSSAAVHALMICDTQGQRVFSYATAVGATCAQQFILLVLVSFVGATAFAVQLLVS